MNNLITYDDWLILERNKTVQYFIDNPDMLKPKFADTPQQKNGPYKPREVRRDDSAEEKTRKIMYESFIKSNGGEDIIWNTDRKEDVKFFEWFSGWDHSRSMSRYTDYSIRLVEAVATSTSISTLEKKIKDSRISIDWKTAINDIDTIWKWMTDNFKIVLHFCKFLKNAISGSRNQAEIKYENDLKKLGLNRQDVDKAMGWIADWTSMSRKRMPSEVWPLLQSISVDSSRLPKFVYRGLFYDGAKIKDQKTFLQKWSAGSRPGASQGKATSWSLDRGTAINFMHAQDFVKDKPNGYYVLLRWEVKPALVIADLRNLPVDHIFWNQQEFIVDPAARDYEVDTIISGSDKAGFDAFRASSRGGQSSYGRTKKDFISQIYERPFDSLDLNQKIEFKKITYMTVDEVAAEYGIKKEWNERIANKIGSVQFPLAMFLQGKYVSGFSMYIENIINSTTLEIGFSTTLDNFYHSSNSELSAIYKKWKDKNDFNQYSCSYYLTGKGTVKMTSPSYYNIDFDIVLPEIFELEDKQEDRTRQTTIDADTAFKGIIEEYGIQRFPDLLKIEVSKISLPKNIQITLK